MEFRSMPAGMHPYPLRSQPSHISVIPPGDDMYAGSETSTFDSEVTAYASELCDDTSSEYSTIQGVAGCLGTIIEVPDRPKRRLRKNPAVSRSTPVLSISTAMKSFDARPKLVKSASIESLLDDLGKNCPWALSFNTTITDVKEAKPSNSSNSLATSILDKNEDDDEEKIEAAIEPPSPSMALLKFCLRCPFIAPKSLLDSKCAICAETYLPFFSMREHETSVKLTCCGNLIGHKCIYNWFRYPQDKDRWGRHFCPFGCAVLNEQGHLISTEAPTTDMKDDEEETFDSTSETLNGLSEDSLVGLTGFDWKRVRNSMTKKERQVWMNRSWRIGQSLWRMGQRFGKNKRAGITVPKSK